MRSSLLHHCNTNNQKQHNGFNQKLNALHSVRHRNKEGTQLFASEVAAYSMVCNAVCMAHHFVFRTYLFTI